MTANTPRSRIRRLSHDPLKRTIVACNRCRGRKTKCLGTSPYPCMTCEEVGADCIYPDVERRIYVSESYLLGLQSRAEAADARRISRETTFSPADVDEESNNNNETDDWWYNGMENLFLSRSGEYQYVGTSSSTYLATKLNPIGNIAWDVAPMYYDNLWLRRPPNPVLPHLPPFEFAKRLYAAQYAYIGSIFAFVQPKHFEDRLVQFYARAPDTSSREDCLVYCQVLLILAFGQMYSLNQWSGTEGPPGFPYFKHALKLLPDIHEEGSVLFVEVLGLVAYFMQILNRRDAAFLYIGLALRMAISLGLHQEVSNTEMDEIEREHRRRVWWSTYSMDRILCVKSGNPISIHDEDMDVAWPSPLPSFDEDLTPPRILAHYSQLSRILGKIGEEIYRKRHKSGTSLLASVQSIMNDLALWLKDVPSELKLDFTNFHHHISREAVSTFLHYYQCVNMTGRPFLLRIGQKRLEALAAGTASPDWKEGLGSNIVHIVSNSIAAARTATTVVRAAAKHNLLATYGFMDGEHAFSAALVLVMANVAFPYDERDATAMEQALSVLKDMAERGNEYIRARHALLLNLRSTLSRQARSVPTEHFEEGSDLDAITNAGSPKAAASMPTPTRIQANFSNFEDLSFNFSTGDNDAFWDEISNDIDIDMNSDWIESVLRNEGT